MHQCLSTLAAHLPPSLLAAGGIPLVRVVLFQIVQQALFQPVRQKPALAFRKDNPQQGPLPQNRAVQLLGERGRGSELVFRVLDSHQD